MAKAGVTETRRVRYEDELYAWTQEQASFLRMRQSDGLDWENLAEEIAAVGRSDRRKLESRLCVVLLHLLKWQAQPGLAVQAGARRCAPSDARSGKLLDDSPSLRRLVPELVREAFPDAVKDAVDEAGLPPDKFPAACTYASDDVLRGGISAG